MMFLCRFVVSALRLFFKFNDCKYTSCSILYPRQTLFLCFINKEKMYLFRIKIEIWMLVSKYLLPGFKTVIFAAEPTIANRTCENLPVTPF